MSNIPWYNKENLSHLVCLYLTLIIYLTNAEKNTMVTLAHH
jgi:hypothetical protein